MLQVRLIDSEGKIAEGKALDILQSGPVEGASTRLTAADSGPAAAGADVVVLADAAGGQGELSGETGIATVRQLRDEEYRPRSSLPADSAWS